MKISLLFIACCLIGSMHAAAQSNILATNAAAEQAMLGNYDPAAYRASIVINHPDSISRGIMTRVSADSLHAYLNVLRTFKNRNTGSDTVSSVTGIGAARRWAYSKFQQFSSQNQNRLLPTYLQFDYGICNMPQHRNIMAVLPGNDTSDKSIVLIEAHIDSRCADLCDTACLAEGMEDNGSGTALVLELARVMSKYTYDHTIVFMITIAEEQGLNGAGAFADYATQKGITIKTVLNNDVVGGIICGQTASQPGCQGAGQIDSTHFRIFSYGGFNSFHKGLARYVKLEYNEMIRPYAAVPMAINIMTPEDRSGRGGDHIPFRQKGFPAAIRLTAANEHGYADVTNPNYTDRQHTSSDILGMDTNGDNVPDSFFVDFNYLARNVVVNGNAAGMIAISPGTPDFTLTSTIGAISGTITQQTQYSKYRVGIRTTTYDWDSVYTISNTTFNFNLPGASYAVSVAAVDDKGVESIFSRELMATVGVAGLTTTPPDVELLQNKPNPFDENTTIAVLVNKEAAFRPAYISIADLKGREVRRLPVTLHKGMNEVLYEHGFGAGGTYIYSLIIDGKKISSRRMVFAN